MFVQEYINSFFHLIYPELCIACQSNDREIEDTFCMECYSSLPFTNQANILKNEFLEHFTGKIKIEHGASLFFFVKQGMIQELIQQLKYLNKPQYGVKIGKLFGKIIKNSKYFNSLDVIIPVPLHPKKEKTRGYNQSQMLAKGISESLSIPICKNNLIRIKNTATQTKMTREERILNLGNAFSITNPEKLIGKHILLIDDVLTTGATLLECGLELKKIKDVKLSLATIAMGDLV